MTDRRYSIDDLLELRILYLATKDNDEKGDWYATPYGYAYAETIDFLEWLKERDD